MATSTYTGGCQCGAVRYQVEADLGQTMTCNCSRCARLGWILTFVPSSAFTLSSGEGRTTTYRFNKHVIDHRFCATCGIQTFAQGKAPDGGQMVAINVRCLDGVDVGTLSPKQVDGRSL